jgi:phosphatidylglycerol:prolipoprotein diacylglycerol transferase
MPLPIPFPAAPALHFGLEVIGVMVAFSLYTRLKKGIVDPISEEHRTYLLIAATLGAVVGSRLLGSLESPELFFSGGGKYGPIYYFQAKTVVGGLLGGLFTIEATKKWLGIRHRSGDVYAFPLMLAMFIGRIGCFGMGVLEPTYGVVTDSWLGIDLGDGTLRHATALYEMLFLLGWAIVLFILKRQVALRPGRLFMLFLSAYLVYRFSIGFQQPLIPVAGLGAIQWACLLGLGWYVIDERFGGADAGAEEVEGQG